MFLTYLFMLCVCFEVLVISCLMVVCVLKRLQSLVAASGKPFLVALIFRSQFLVSCCYVMLVVVFSCYVL